MTLTKEQINRAIGQQIRAGMALRNFTVEMLAEATDESPSTITRIRKGSDIQISKLYKIADALDISPVKLVGEAIADAEKNN